MHDLAEEVRFEDVLEARAAVRSCLPETPLYEYPVLSRLLGCHYWLKHENHQPVGAFKVRGGVNLVQSLPKHDSHPGIIAVSTGNHGLSLAWASRGARLPCTIVLPANCNKDKVRAVRELGAAIVQYGRDFDEAKEHCERLAAQAWKNGSNLRYVHSANEPKLIAGVGTFALEIFERLPEPDVLLVPVGLGSGICGAALVARQLSPKTRVIGVQAEGAPAVAQSWRSGQEVVWDKLETKAEGLATRRPAELTLGIMRRLVDDFVLVSEAEIDQAIRWLLEATHNLAEGAGAATTAAAWKLRDQLRGLRVVAVLSGGNLDLRILPDILRGTLPLDAATS